MAARRSSSMPASRSRSPAPRPGRALRPPRAHRARRPRLSARARGPDPRAARRGAGRVSTVTLRVRVEPAHPTPPRAPPRPPSTTNRVPGSATFAPTARRRTRRSRGSTRCSCGPPGSRSPAGGRRCPTCAARSSTTSRSRPPTTRCSACSGGSTTSAAQPLHDLGVQVRAARGGGEAAQARLAGPRDAARARDVGPLRECRPAPEEQAEQCELLAAVRDGIADALTPHQRRVLLALAVTASRSTSSPTGSARRAAPSTRPFTTRGASCARTSTSAASRSSHGWRSD